MNWYKLSQLVMKDIDEEPMETNYLDIGHSVMMGKKPKKKWPNYMWIFNNGKIEFKEETIDEPTHRNAFPNFNFNGAYAGRYESKTKRISVGVPHNKKMFDIPNPLIMELQRKFPEAIYLYRF